MGLDQYLHAEKHVSGYTFSPEGNRTLYGMLVGWLEADSIVDPETPIATVKFTAAYWRKANAIHRWFVENVQGGNDDCGDYYVSRDQLANLRTSCLRVLGGSETKPGEVYAGTSWHNEGGETVEERLTREGEVVVNPEIAQEHLPTQEGFFFGATDYDDGYIYDLRATVEQLDRVLASDEQWQFSYQSSW